LRVYTSFLSEFKIVSDDKEATYDLMTRIIDLIEPIFIFALVWSFGVALDDLARRQFDTLLKGLAQRHNRELGYLRLPET
jgi:hypothetical protein